MPFFHRNVPPEGSPKKAPASLSSDERQKIAEQETIRPLFQQLNAADQGHQGQSLLRKGLSAVKPYLEQLHATIDFIGPSASFEPAAGTALGLVKGYESGDGESAKLDNFYRSILLQLLAHEQQLKLRFWDCYKKTSPLAPGNLTQADDKLRELLYDVISSFRKPAFIIPDALDECGNKARLKVFVPSRYNNDIEADLPLGFTRLEMQSSRDRDPPPRAAFHAQVVEALAAKSGGSVICLRIAVEYIAEPCIKNQRGLDMALDRLPSSKGLAELYGKLFAKVCEAVPENETLLQRALEIIALARQPLTPEELAYAVFVANPDGGDNPAMLAELDELAHSVDLFEEFEEWVLLPDFDSKGTGEAEFQLLSMGGMFDDDKEAPATPSQPSPDTFDPSSLVVTALFGEADTELRRAVVKRGAPPVHRRGGVRAPC
ncbi:hypothetical protein B0H67DRAFT_607389 [Lasiosphaeris hirsuta]|uniref:Nephrocystin 3-like N-terminal domain-containing protein n=1 Tax=Lasiosphaeris hirsuta TaxID=260670 RepID=A0AA40AZU3_9PEZI|nr:hypothetical protein B0H67DRAFT_607389 [Lasiosphaeris hirsuta]